MDFRFFTMLRGEQTGQPMIIIAGTGTSLNHFYFHMLDLLLFDATVYYKDLLFSFLIDHHSATCTVV